MRLSTIKEPMSYLVIARKWRPQTFEEVVGQPHVTRTLQNAIRSNRIAHAYLFTGARGVGKTSVARILAKTINCEQGVSGVPCNVCSNCREITQGNSVDVLEIDGASNRGIDSIRELRETVLYRPSKSRRKIYIVDEVHMLTQEAFNALLKTLEEPPEHVLFVFATTEPHKIPATILSRCQRFDFRRIPTPQLTKHLKEIAAKEGAALSDSLVFAVAREADGSMRDGQSLLEQLLAFSGDELTEEEILDVLGVVDLRSVRRTGKAILDGDAGTCLEVVDDLYRRGIDSRRFCQQLCEYFRNLIFLAVEVKSGESRLDLPADEIRFLREEVSRTNRETLYLYFQTVMKGEEEIRRSSLPRVSLEMLLVRLTYLPKLESLQETLGKLEKLEKDLEGSGPCVLAERSPAYGRPSMAPEPERPERKESLRPVVASPPEPASAVPGRPAEASEPEPSPFAGESGPPIDSYGEARGGEPPDLDPEPGPDPVVSEKATPQGEATAGGVAEHWPDFIRWLREKEPILAAKLTRSEARAAPDSAVEIHVHDLYEDAFKDAQLVDKLSGLANGFFKGAFSWRVRVKSASAAKEAEHAKRPKPNLKRAVLEHPAVVQAIEVLGGELLEIRSVKKTKRGESPPRE